MRYALLVCCLAGCAAEIDGPSVAAVPGRADVTLLSYRAHVAGGLSDPVAVEVPSGVSAVLIEVAGATGQFRLAQLETPSGRDVVESGGFVTRDAREVGGLVDWLYPNSPSLALQSGRHILRFTALGDGGRVVADEDVTVRLYMRTGGGAGGAIKLDILFADDALDPGAVDDVAATLAGRVAALYAQAGVSVADYTAATLHLGGASSLPLDGGKLSASSLQALEAAVTAAGARADAVHLVIVHALDDGNGPVAGYSLGLPGPFAPDRPTAAVLVSAASFASPSTGALDTDGLAVTCAHEIGHYLGLYHTSESDGQEHDPIADTPECGDGSVCPDADNVMFWTGGSARSRLTAGQGAVMRLHPLVVATAAPPLATAACDDACNVGDTCVVIAGQSVCATACEPGSTPCTTGRCAASDDGTFVCRAD